MCVIHKKGVFSLNMSPYSALCRHFPLLYLYQSNSCEFYPFSCNEHVSSSNIDYFMSLKMFIDFLNSIPILKALNRARGPVQWFWALRARKAVKSTPPPFTTQKKPYVRGFHSCLQLTQRRFGYAGRAFACATLTQSIGQGPKGRGKWFLRLACAGVRFQCPNIN